MRTIDDAPRDQRFLMLTSRLSRTAWEEECRVVRKWLADPPDTISEAESAEMLAKIDGPLPASSHPFAVIHCYADLPAGTRWNTAFDPSIGGQHETTDVVLQFGIFWRRLVLPSLEDGHHQIAVIEFSDGLPQLLASLPVDPEGEVIDYIGLCASDDFPGIRRGLANRA